MHEPMRKRIRRPTLDAETTAWTAAVLLFGVGDIVTTLSGISYGLPEANPLYATLFEVADPTAVLVGLKAIGFVALVALYRAVESRRLVVPVGVAVMGGLITGLNLLGLWVVA